jgi:hypothetical protein
MAVAGKSNPALTFRGTTAYRHFHALRRQPGRIMPAAIVAGTTVQANNKIHSSIWEA